jgi:hypothetical protein
MARELTDGKGSGDTILASLEWAILPDAASSEFSQSGRTPRDFRPDCYLGNCPEHQNRVYGPGTRRKRCCIRCNKERPGNASRRSHFALLTSEGAIDGDRRRHNHGPSEDAA